MLADKLKRETERVNEVWRMSCEQVSSFNEAVTVKDAGMNNLKASIAELEASRLDPAAPPTHTPVSELPRIVICGPVPHPSPHLSQKPLELV